MSTLFLLLFVLLAMMGGAIFTVGRFRVDDESSGGALSVVVAPCVLALYLASAAMGVVIGWENSTGAGDGLTTEVGAAESLYWSTTALPEEEARVVRGELRSYLSAVAEKDWPRMRSAGELSAESERAFADLAGRGTGQIRRYLLWGEPRRRCGLGRNRRFFGAVANS